MRTSATTTTAARRTRRRSGIVAVLALALPLLALAAASPAAAASGPHAPRQQLALHGDGLDGSRTVAVSPDYATQWKLAANGRSVVRSATATGAKTGGFPLAARAKLSGRTSVDVPFLGLSPNGAYLAVPDGGTVHGHMTIDERIGVFTSTGRLVKRVELPHNAAMVCPLRSVKACQAADWWGGTSYAVDAAATPNGRTLVVLGGIFDDSPYSATAATHKGTRIHRIYLWRFNLKTGKLIGSTSIAAYNPYLAPGAAGFEQATVSVTPSGSAAVLVRQPSGPASKVQIQLYSVATGKHASTYAVAPHADRYGQHGSDALFGVSPTGRLVYVNATAGLLAYDVSARKASVVVPDSSFLGGWVGGTTPLSADDGTLALSPDGTVEYATGATPSFSGATAAFDRCEVAVVDARSGYTRGHLTGVPKLAAPCAETLSADGRTLTLTDANGAQAPVATAAALLG